MRRRAGEGRRSTDASSFVKSRQGQLCAQRRAQLPFEPRDDLLPRLGGVLRRQGAIRRLEGERVGQAALSFRPGAVRHLLALDTRRTAARRPAACRPIGGSRFATCAAGTDSSTISARSSNTAGCDEKAVISCFAPQSCRMPARSSSATVTGRLGRSKAARTLGCSSPTMPTSAPLTVTLAQRPGCIGRVRLAGRSHATLTKPNRSSRASRAHPSGRRGRVARRHA